MKNLLLVFGFLLFSLVGSAQVVIGGSAGSGGTADVKCDSVTWAIFANPVTLTDTLNIQSCWSGGVVIDKDTIVTRGGGISEDNNWKNISGNNNTNTTDATWREEAISLGSAESKALVNVDIAAKDTTGFSARIKTNEEEKIWTIVDENGDEVFTFRVHKDEGAMIMGSPLPGLTYGNPKIASFTSFSGGESGRKLIYPLASTMFGYNNLVECVDCNSFDVSGYQVAHHVTTGKNFTARGTDAFFSAWRLVNSNGAGRHLFFNTTTGEFANIENVNVSSNDSFDRDTFALNIVGGGNFSFQHTKDVRNVQYGGEEIARYREGSIWQSSLFGTQAASTVGVVTGQAGLFASDLGGYRIVFNTNNLEYTTGRGYLSGAMNSYNELYNVTHSVRDGAFSAQNIYGSFNTNIGFGSGAFTTPTKRDGTITLGSQAGRGWIDDNELAIDNSTTTSPLIYGNMATDSLGINGKLSVSELPSGANYTEPVFRDPSTLELGTNSSTGGTMNTLYNADDSIKFNSPRLVGLNDHLRFIGDGNIGINVLNPTNGKIQILAGSDIRAIFAQNNSNIFPTGTFYQLGSATSIQSRNFGSGIAGLFESNSNRSLYVVNSSIIDSKEAALFQHTANENNSVQTVFQMFAKSASGGQVGHGGRFQFFADNASAIGVGTANIYSSFLDSSTGRSKLVFGVAGDNRSNILSEAMVIEGEAGNLVDHVIINADLELTNADLITNATQAYVRNPTTGKTALQELATNQNIEQTLNQGDDANGGLIKNLGGVIWNDGNGDGTKWQTNENAVDGKLHIENSSGLEAYYFNTLGATDPDDVLRIKDLPNSLNTVFTYHTSGRYEDLMAGNTEVIINASDFIVTPNFNGGTFGKVIINLQVVSSQDITFNLYKNYPVNTGGAAGFIASNNNSIVGTATITAGQRFAEITLSESLSTSDVFAMTAAVPIPEGLGDESKGLSILFVTQ